MDRCLILAATSKFFVLIPLKFEPTKWKAHAALVIAVMDDA